MAARKRKIHRHVQIHPLPGHAQKPGSHGRARRSVKSTQNTLPATPDATKMPRWPMGYATTKRNQDRLPPK